MPSSSHPRRLAAPLALLAVLLVVGAVLRWWHAGESLWLDELHTAWCTVGGLAEVMPRAGIGNQSPLYFWLQWIVVQTLGGSELTLRLTSLVAGTLLPAAALAVVWRWTASVWLGLVAAALVVFDPMSIYYATEARPYALVQLLAVGHVATAAEMLRQPAWHRRGCFIVSAAALFYLHYTAALVVIATTIVLAGWAVRRGAKYPLRWLAIDLAIVAALCLPAALHLGEVFGRRGNWAGFIGQRPLGEIFDVLPWSAAAGIVLAAVLAMRLLPQQRDRESPAATHPGFLHLAIAWLLVPLAIAWAATATDAARLLYHRYLVASSPAAMILTAMSAALAPWPRVGRSLVAAAIVTAGLLVGIVPLWRDGRVFRPRGEDWRGAVAWLNEQLPTQRYPVLVRSGLVESNALREEHDPLLEDYCLLPVTSLYLLRAPRTDLVPLPSLNPGLVEDDIVDFLQARGGAWLVVRTPRQSNAEFAAQQLVSRMQESGVGSRESGVGGRESGVGGQESGVGSRGWRVVEARSFGGVHLLLLEP